MYEEQAFVQILNIYRILKKCITEEKYNFSRWHTKGKLAGIEFCMSKLGYGFYFEKGEWIIKRKMD